MENKNTFQLIYDIVRQIPKGKVATYGQIATLAGNPRLARVVGYALHVNPEPMIIPCHRVVNREGYTSGSFAFGGKNAQGDLLRSEGVETESEGRVDLKSTNGGVFLTHFFELTDKKSPIRHTA